MNNNTEIKTIFERCVSGTATEAESLLFWKWTEEPGNEAAAQQMIEAAFVDGEPLFSLPSGTARSIVEAIVNAEKNKLSSSVPVQDAPVVAMPGSSVIGRNWYKYAAAVVLLAAGIYVWKFGYQPKASIEEGTQVKVADIQPGGNKAILTLADGTNIVLDTVYAGNLAAQGNTIIVQERAGSLMYSSGEAGEDLGYNTIATPRGGQYHVKLPDGSKVWLNAASSIRFPVAFTQSRQLEISGEVYFEVAADKNNPFKVVVNGLEVNILGTSFNINAYSNEPFLTTTLLDGKIRLVAGNADSIVLKPGQQAILSNKEGERASNNVFRVSNADIENVMAWRNGFFNFSKASLPEIMRQLERWYDINVSYKGDVPSIALQGKMQRDLNLSEMLELLSNFNIQYEIKGREIILTSNQK